MVVNSETIETTATSHEITNPKSTVTPERSDGSVARGRSSARKLTRKKLKSPKKKKKADSSPSTPQYEKPTEKNGSGGKSDSLSPSARSRSPIRNKTPGNSHFSEKDVQSRSFYKGKNKSPKTPQASTSVSDEQGSYLHTMPEQQPNRNMESLSNINRNDTSSLGNDNGRNNLQTSKQTSENTIVDKPSYHIRTSQSASQSAAQSPSPSKFRSICQTLENLYNEALSVNDGMQADYIPELAAVNPELFAMAVVSTDGDTWTYGDAKVPFTMQSTCKPLLYAMAQQLAGWEEVHEHIGYEPSGQRFNAFVLDENKNPHNPMINAGAVMSSAIIWSKFKQKVL